MLVWFAVVVAALVGEVHGRKPWRRCYVCGRQCRSMKELRLHNRQAHTINYRPDELEPFD